MRTVCLVSSTKTWRAFIAYVKDIRHDHDESQPSLLVGRKPNSAVILAYPNPEALHVIVQFGVKYALG